MPAERKSRDKSAFYVPPGLKRAQPQEHMQRPKRTIRIPPIQGMHLFIARLKKILEAKGCEFLSLEFEVWDAWRNLSDRARSMWAAEEGLDREEDDGSRFYDVFKVMPDDTITPMNVYAEYMSLPLATAQQEWDSEDTWVRHYCEVLVLEIRVDNLSPSA